MEILINCFLAIVLPTLVAAVDNLEFSNEVAHAGTRRGHWSPWRHWVMCSRTCGGGITFRTRSCTIGNSRVDSENCIGQYKEYTVCNNEPCPGGNVDFRSIQCSMYDDLDPYGVVRHWSPIPGLNDNCDLFCEKHVSSSETLSRDMGVVVDGTSCTRPDGPGACIQGQCRSVGCDGRLDSKLKFDKCGECGGTNRSCGLLSGRFTLELTEEELFHYYDVVTFQPGTRNITVEETSDRNYLALSVDADYHLNGDWDVDLPGVFSAAGTLFTYERRRDGYEKITSSGPTNALVQISIIVRSTDPLVTYQFYLPKTPTVIPTSTIPEYRPPPPHRHNTVAPDTGELKEPATCQCGTGVRGNDVREESDGRKDHNKPAKTKKKTEAEKSRPKKDKQQMKKEMKDSCGPCEKSKGKIRNFCRSDFVVRANVLSRAVESNMTRYDIEIEQTFTNQMTLFSREYVWVPNICNCPKMKPGREYLIMGNRVQSPTSQENLLMVDRDKMVVRWNPDKFDMWDTIQATSTTKCDKYRRTKRNKKRKKSL